VRAHTRARVHKVRAAVQERLTREINHWDYRANELDELVAAGRQPKMNPDRARQRANDLSARRKRRMDELNAEEALQALPPVVVGAALVVPQGLLAELGGDPHEVARDAVAAEAIDRLAVDAVMAWEERLGRDPEEMPHNNPGFDVRSRTPGGHYLFLEVKGHAAGADTVAVTRNQILHGLNSDAWVLALVEVAPDDSTRVRYLRTPFRGQIDDLGFKESSRIFPWRPLWEAGGPPA
jgi:hypothetical protein